MNSISIYRKKDVGKGYGKRKFKIPKVQVDIDDIYPFTNGTPSQERLLSLWREFESH
jgi:hypothetical protein